MDVFGFEPRLTLEEEDRVIGVVVGHCSGLTLGLHFAPAVAQALAGYCPVAFSVSTTEELIRCCDRLDSAGVGHSAPAEGHLGWYVEVPDPDGIVIELHTLGQPTADEA